MADDRLAIARGAIQDALAAVARAQKQLLSPSPVPQLPDPAAASRALRDVRARLAHVEGQLASLGAPAAALQEITPPEGDPFTDARDALLDAQLGVLAAKDALLGDHPPIAGIAALRPDLEELTGRLSDLLEPLLEAGGAA